MKNKKILTIILLLSAALLLSSCGTGFGASSWPGVTYDADNQSIYVAYNQQVYGLQAENGAQRWAFPAEPDNGVSFFAPPALTADGQIIIAGYNNVAYSLDPQNSGRQIWSFEGASNRFIGSPLASEDLVFAPNADHLLYTLNMNGELQWTFAAEEPLWSQPALDGSTLYLGSMDHKVYALNASNGNLLWEQDLGGSIVGRPAIDEQGNLYVGTFNSEVVALRGSNGRVLWTAETGDWVWGGPSLADGVVYAGDLSGNLYALDIDNGNQLWSVSAEGAITGSPLVTNDSVYIGTENGKVLSVSLDGRIQWTQTVDGQLYSTPVAAGDLLLFGVVDSDTVLIALDSNGNTEWSFVPNN